MSTREPASDETAAIDTTPTGVRRAALAFVFVTVAIDILAFGIIIPVLPHLIQDFVGGDTALAARWVGAFGTVYALMQFAFSPMQGALSDRFGRRPVILLSNLGLAIDFVLMAVVNTLPLLFLGRVLSGITAASFSAANAYIADVTPPEKRAAGFGMMGAAFGIGFVIGPALGGWLGSLDVRAPFWVAAGLAAANFLYGYFILPESLPRERRTRFKLSEANPVGSLLLIRRYPQVYGLIAIVFLSMLAHYVLPAVFVLYADYRYGWDERDVGYVLALVGICSAIVQAGLAGRVVARFGERRALVAGLVAGAAGFALYGLADRGWLFLVAVPVMAFWGLSTPAAQSLMTRMVAPHEQGRLQGAVTSVGSTAGIFGPALFATVFATFIGERADWHLPGAAFLLAALLLLIGTAVALWTTRPAHVVAVQADVQADVRADAQADVRADATQPPAPAGAAETLTATTPP